MAIIKRTFTEVDIDNLGTEINHVVGNYSGVSGTIEQVVIYKISGSATTINVQIRYESDDSTLTNLVYKYDDGELDFIDSSIDAPFSLRSPNRQTDLYLYLEPDADCQVNIRIDIRLD